VQQEEGEAEKDAAGEEAKADEAGQDAEQAETCWKANRKT
jgi:hypothetical protein